MLSVLDWVYPIRNKAKSYSAREVIGDKFALTAPDYTRLYLGVSEVEKNNRKLCVTWIRESVDDLIFSFMYYKSQKK